MSFLTVTTAQELRDAVRTYQKEIAAQGPAGEALRQAIAYAQVWVATRESPDTSWIFAPAKFVGYVGLTAQSYTENHRGDLHGRDAERAILSLRDHRPRRMLNDSGRFDEVHRALVTFCAQHESKPNARVQILEWMWTSGIARLDRDEDGAGRSRAAFVEARALLAAAIGVRPENIDIVVRG